MIKNVLLVVILLVSYLSVANEPVKSKQDYINQITKKIHSEWRLIKADDGWTCRVNIIQDKEGNILDSNISKCNTKDKRFISQLQKAIDKSSPLPKAPEGLFTRNVTIYPKIKGDIDLFKSINKKYKAGDPVAKKLVILLRKMLKEKDSLTIKLKQMSKEGNPVALEVIENMRKMVNEFEEQQ